MEVELYLVWVLLKSSFIFVGVHHHHHRTIWLSLFACNALASNQFTRHVFTKYGFVSVAFHSACVTLFQFDIDESSRFFSAFFYKCRPGQSTTPRRFYYTINRYHFTNFGKSIRIIYTNIGYGKTTQIRSKQTNIKCNWAMSIIAVKIKTNYAIRIFMMGIIE